MQKNILIFSLAAILFFSCFEEQDYPEPSISLRIEGNTFAYPGDTLYCITEFEGFSPQLLSLYYEIYGDTSVIEKIELNKTEPQGIWDEENSRFVEGVKSGKLYYNIYISNNAPIGDRTQLKFSIFDDNAKINHNYLYLTVADTVNNDTVPPEPIYKVGEYTQVTLTYTSTSLNDANMFNLNSGTAITPNGNAEDMDLAFCWQTIYGYSIVPPNSAWLSELWNYNGLTYTTADKNATKLAKVIQTWAEIDVDAIDAISVIATDDLQYLENGDIIAFETINGDKAFMRVNIAKVTHTIIVDVKYKVAFKF